MNKIVLTSRIDYHNTLTEGNPYVPVAQSKTGFLVEGDDGVIIDLYAHFFIIGIQDEKGNITNLISSEKYLSSGRPTKELPKETKEIKETTKEELVSEDFEVEDFIENADEVLEETGFSPEEESKKENSLNIDIDDF